ncbi:DNA replication licensing factor mcm5-B [Orchesella cincta]|uniref:DNA replication licensing factor mcm5-B n=1 Tax=Orchesella cincta TaxID=48709 RepID=A0A1D2MFJ0_ORCCI|nr:DNA replication licensing factor mcm5-B [Orchesella cincta]
MCRSCRSVLPNIAVKSQAWKVMPYLESALPNQGAQAGSVKCPLDPYFILPDRCDCVDFQVLKLQESPDSVPSA